MPHWKRSLSCAPSLRNWPYMFYGLMNTSHGVGFWLTSPFPPYFQGSKRDIDSPADHNASVCL
ncbi:Hypothetical predicted protein, partial [Marmota monax]